MNKSVNRFMILDNLTEDLTVKEVNKNLKKPKNNPRNNEPDIGRDIGREERIIKKNKIKIPEEITEQIEKYEKYNYLYEENENGNIYNNSTFYATTVTAHAYQIAELFSRAIEKAKKMPEIFGEDFECNFIINHVIYSDGNYVGHAFIDVDNPKIYYALLGKKITGEENVKYINDPEWICPNTICQNEEESSKQIKEPPKIKIELPPILSLDKYLYDEKQYEKQLELYKSKTYNIQKHGIISISPAYITSKGLKNGNDKQLYVKNIPSHDQKFLLKIFARYARTKPDDNRYYPHIKIHTNKKGDLFAIVTYFSSYDAAFALVMCKKIKAEYNGNVIEMNVRYAKNVFNYKNEVSTLLSENSSTNDEFICCENSTQ